MVSFVSYDVHCVLWCQLSGACIQTPGAESLLGSHSELGKNFLHLEHPAFCFALQHVGRIIQHLLVVSKKKIPSNSVHSVYYFTKPVSLTLSAHV